MNQNAPIHYLGSKEVPFTLGGQRLTELRRARLRGVAKALKINPDGTKNELLHRIIAKLKAVNAESEIGKL